jgi:hypothetical protein
MEEMEFAFGARNDRAPYANNVNQFKRYYDPERTYHVPSSSTVVVCSSDTEASWEREVFGMVRNLETNQKSGSISYLNRRLVNGQVYGRALGVWSSAVYRLVAPSMEDLTHRLPNTIGLDPEMQDSGRGDFKTAKRLAEIYIQRLAPAVHYLCQKMEFLLLKNFDTAWRVLLRFDESKTFTGEAVGGEEFKTEVRLQFQQAVRKRAGIAYDRCFSDLHHGLQKLVELWVSTREPAFGERPGRSLQFGREQ